MTHDNRPIAAQLKAKGITDEEVRGMLAVANKYTVMRQLGFSSVTSWDAYCRKIGVTQLPRVASTSQGDNALRPRIEPLDERIELRFQMQTADIALLRRRVADLERLFREFTTVVSQQISDRMVSNLLQQIEIPESLTEELADPLEVPA